MDGEVALNAECDEIVSGVVPGVAAELLMMHFEVRHCAAVLTPPAVPAEHFIVKLFVRLWV